MVETLRLNDPRLKSLLNDFRVSTPDGIRVARPLRLDPQSSISNPQTLVMELIPASSWQRPRFLKRWIMAARVPALLTTLASALTVMFIGLKLGLHLNPSLFITALLGALGLQMGVHFLNDYEDHMRLLDLPQTSRRNRVIQEAWIPAKHVRWAGWLAISFGVLMGVPAFFAHPVFVGILGCVGFMGATGYSGWPLWQ